MRDANLDENVHLTKKRQKASLWVPDLLKFVHLLHLSLNNNSQCLENFKQPNTLALWGVVASSLDASKTTFAVVCGELASYVERTGTRQHRLVIVCSNSQYSLHSQD